MKKPLNRLLLRQIRRKVGGVDKVPDECRELLEAISQSYDHYERDKTLIQRAMDLSSQELRETYEKLALQAELKRSNKELEQFAYIASHDLREPLRVISAFVGLIQHRLNVHLDEETTEYMDYVIAGVGRMNQLLEDLLQYAAVGKKDKEVCWVNLDQLIQTVQKNLTLKIERTQASFAIAPLPLVKAYPSQLLQLFQNLIANALKYHSAATPHIQIAELLSEDDAYRTIIVQDNGIGIAPENQERIFKIFQRLHSGYKGGTGIGLAICHKVVTELGGAISVTSQLGEGATFSIHLPATICRDKGII